VDLAYHFYEAGEWNKAAEYGQQAGERALLLYAPRAALEHLNRTLDALKHLGKSPPAAVFRTRGQANETIGEIERALSDYEAALSIARQDGDGIMEWQSLLDIGFLWAGRDYAQSVEWYLQSLDLAQKLGDPRLQARSLNRYGNWLINAGQVAEGLRAHEQALAIFERLHETRGLADSHDLLGMANGIYGDTVKAAEEYEQAIAALRSLADNQGLLATLASRTVFAGPAWCETTPSACEAFERCAHDIEEAQRLVRQLDSPSSQAYVELNAALVYSSFGALGRGLAHAQKTVRLSAEIGHSQWLAGGYLALGRSYLSLLDAARAIEAFEVGLPLALETGSAWWTGNIRSYLARAYILQGLLAQARETLEAAIAPSQQPVNSPERRLLWAWGELSLATGEPQMALSIAERLISSVPGASDSQPIPWLMKLKGEALGACQRHEEAVAALEEAAKGAAARGERPLEWQIYCSLGRLYGPEDKRAEQSFKMARQEIESLASAIEEKSTRQQFASTALSTIPPARMPSARRVAKESYGGLTAREREVVALIAGGKSNLEIASDLVVAKSTVETHINNILSKLNLTSRAQLVVWALEKGLAGNRPD
jgi:ATP/maltotriose-dependent transcriptional regulator MalT